MNLGPETELVEHKRSTGELEEGIASMASILNKHGRGTLYFGVLNNGDVVGQQVSDSTLRKVSQTIAHSIAPAVYPTVERLVADGGEDYVRVTFEGPDAPYACKNVYRIRVADEDRFMEPDMLESMVLERAYRRKPWDRQSSPRPLSDVEEAELMRFVERGRRRGRIAFEHESVERTLASLGLLAANGSLTNAAEVLFVRRLTSSSRWASSRPTCALRHSTCARNLVLSSPSSTRLSTTSLTISVARSSSRAGVRATRYPRYPLWLYARRS